MDLDEAILTKLELEVKIHLEKNKVFYMIKTF